MVKLSPPTPIQARHARRTACRTRPQLSAVLLRAQDVAPKGGYPTVRTNRNLPKGGASALVMATASVFVFGWGMYKIIKANQLRRCAPSARSIPAVRPETGRGPPA